MERGLGLLRGAPMTALLYRGHAYAAAPATPKACVELTYRRERNNTCRQELIVKPPHPHLPGRHLHQVARSLYRLLPLPLAVVVGQPDGGKSRSKGDPGILWVSK